MATVEEHWLSDCAVQLVHIRPVPAEHIDADPPYDFEIINEHLLHHWFCLFGCAGRPSQEDIPQGIDASVFCAAKTVILRVGFDCRTKYGAVLSSQTRTENFPCALQHVRCWCLVCLFANPHRMM